MSLRTKAWAVYVNAHFIRKNLVSVTSRLLLVNKRRWTGGHIFTSSTVKRSKNIFKVFPWIAACHQLKTKIQEIWRRWGGEEHFAWHCPCPCNAQEQYKAVHGLWALLCSVPKQNWCKSRFSYKQFKKCKTHNLPSSVHNLVTPPPTITFKRTHTY